MLGFPMFLLLLATFACTDGDAEKPVPAPTDADGDGFDTSEDCDDADPQVHPRAAEVCDPRDADEDCDGASDDADDDATGTATWYEDEDEDGYGEAASQVDACDLPEGYVADASDCDDTDPTVSPAATELCDDADIDEDCDGLSDDADESPADPATWYADADADGYGDAAAGVDACQAPPGYVADGTDCDDTSARIHPGATETDCADRTDYNCDGSVSYADADGDGHAACEECDDGNASVNPSAVEACNALDDDCDGTTDESEAADAATWYADADSDGYGDAGTIAVACDAPAGHTADATDCDDVAPAVNPAAIEVCDGIDNDCDGDRDPVTAADASTWYADADEDGYGDGRVAATACEPPPGFVADATDCDDASATVNPGATEACGGGDEDCDAAVDEDDASLDRGTLGTWYTDADGDGFGADATAIAACEAPTGTVATGGDCDEGDVGVHPGVAEACDDADQDCDGTADDGVADCVDGIEVPADPSVSATALDVAVAGNLSDAVAFLYTGADPVQTDVDEDELDPTLVGVLRGRVLDSAGDALAAVTVSVLDHPEYGQTLTRTDGEWDLVVNGGSDLTLVFARDGWLQAQRHVDAEAQGWSVLDDVVLLEPDPIGTAVGLDGTSTAAQVAEGSAQTDGDGTRQAIVFFPAGVSAEMIVDGAFEPLDAATVRVTEYTVGELGPAAMPGDLPPSSAYTYAVELSADEADAAGASSVQFSQDVSLWVTNFLGFDPGTVIPFGWYDREAGAWIPADNGLVVEVLDVSTGVAELDVDGTGVAADVTELATLGFSTEELTALASAYSAGDTLWRVTLDHFTPTDCNWPYDLPEDNEPPPDDDDENEDQPPPCPPSTVPGSIVECESQTLREVVPVAGTPLSLRYHSDRVPGYTARNTVTIALTDGTLPDSVQAVVLELEIAGQETEERWESGETVPQTYTYTWDRLDAYGRTVQGAEELTIRVGYEYGAVYVAPNSSTTRAFSAYGDTTEVYTDRAASRIDLWETRTVEMGAWNQASAGLGGWSLDAHHAYDPDGQVAYLGTGARVEAREVEYVGRVVAGTGTAACTGEGSVATDAPLGILEGIAVAPDGTVYFSDSYCEVVWRVGDDGLLYRVAGTIHSSGSTGDGGDPRLAKLANPYGIALDGEGNLYIADGSNNRVRKVTFQADGTPATIATVAGGRFGFAGDGGDATSASLCVPYDVDIDEEGSLYITDVYASGACGYRVRKVDPAGIIETFAGRGSGWYLGSRGDEGVATDARFVGPYAVAVGPEGEVYLSDYYVVRAVDTTGIIDTFAGSTHSSALGGELADGEAATSADFDYVYGLAVDAAGRVYFSDQTDDVIRRVETDGTLTTIAGSFVSSNNALATVWPGDGAAARTLTMGTPKHLDIGPAGSVYYVDSAWRGVIALEPPFPAYDADDVLISLGGEVLHFDADGRHLYTYDAATGATRFAFAYASYGDDELLVSVTDAYGGVTTVTRDIDGTATGITSPDGVVTALGHDGNGWLDTVADPAGVTWEATFDDDGLLQSFDAPAKGVTTMTWDDDGRLLGESDAVGGSKTLARAGGGDEWEVSLTTGDGEETLYGTTYESDGSTIRTVVPPDGRTQMRVIEPDGSATLTLGDGTVVTTEYAGDPRFGMQAPYAVSTTRTTPGGVTSTMTVVDRRVELSDPSDLLSLVSQTDEVDLDGETTTTVFDAISGTYTRTSAEGRVLVSTVDASGAVEGLAWGDLEATTFTRDTRGRVTAMAQGSRSWAFSYDSSGNVSTLTDPAARVASWTYDAAGRPLTESLPGSRTLSYGYDEGALTSLTTPNGDVHAFAYDDVGHLARYTPPDLGLAIPSVTYAYDLDGRLVEVERMDGGTIAYTWDEGRLARVSHPEGTTTLSWDATGNLAGVADPDASLAFTWDGSLPTGEVLSAGTVTGTLGWEWETPYRVASVSVNGDAVAYEYDGDGFVIGAGELVIDRDAATGAVAGTLLGVVDTEETRDGYGATTSLSAYAGSTVVFGETYTTDSLGRITTVADAFTGEVWTYTYTDEGWLASAAVAGGAWQTYTYDANGNRLTVTDADGTSAASYDAQDRLETFGGATYTWADSGELTAVTDAGGDTTTYTYDASGNLTRVDFEGGTVVEYLVDPMNRRVGKVVDGVLEQGFLWQSALQVAAELDDTGAVLSRFVYASGRNVPDYMEREGAVYRIVTDLRGSVRAVVDVDTGTVVQQLAYDAWGVVADDTNPGFQPFGYAGGLYDPDTGLVRFGARDYDPAVGRWTAKDPIGFHGGLNVYTYASSDPVSHRDQTGQYTEVVFWEPVGHGASSGGHVSVNINGINYSWELNGMNVSAFDSYAADQSSNRSGRGLIVPLTPEQELGLASYLGNARAPGYHLAVNNCGQQALKGLMSVGVGVPDGTYITPNQVMEGLGDAAIGQTFYPGPAGTGGGWGMKDGFWNAY